MPRPDPARAATPTPGFRARSTDDTMPSQDMAPPAQSRTPQPRLRRQPRRRVRRARNETDIWPDDGYLVCLPDRPTATEARLWRLAGGDPAKYTDLAIEYSDEIEADRAAGGSRRTRRSGGNRRSSGNRADGPRHLCRGPFCFSAELVVEGGPDIDVAWTAIKECAWNVWRTSIAS